MFQFNEIISSNNNTLFGPVFYTIEIYFIEIEIKIELITEYKKY